MSVLVLVVTGLGLLAAFAVYSRWQQVDEEMRRELAGLVVGEIVSPRNDQTVDRQIPVVGNANAVPIVYFDLRLVVEVADASGETRLFWPKKHGENDDTLSNGSWQTTVSEGGSPPEGRFVLSLWLVTKEGTKRIQEWLEGGDYSGLEEVPGGARRLASTRLQLADN